MYIILTNIFSYTSNSSTLLIVQQASLLQLMLFQIMLSKTLCNPYYVPHTGKGKEGA